MKKTPAFLIFTVLIFWVNSLPAQSNIVFTMIVGDTAVLSVSGHNGSVQWQKSPDSLNWIDINGATNNTLTIITDTSYTGKRFFRAKVTDTLCPPYTPVYGSAIRHRIIANAAQVQIGDWFHGGIVFYVDSTGHGLIAPTQDQKTYCQWGCYGTAIGSATQSTTNGAANTAAIVAFHDGLPNYYGNPAQCNPGNNGTVAAKLCDTISINGYNDWFLPAKYQLNLLYQQKNRVEGFAAYCYWSSTEYDESHAWSQGFNNGTQYNSYKGDYDYLCVRCVRSF